jgi:formylglycine-generating enzyme required for sulfatase activity
MTTTTVARNAGGIALPGLLLVGLLALLGIQTEVIRLPNLGEAAIPGPQTVLIAPRPFTYRASGDFVRESASVDGPLLQVDQPHELEIMKYQVSAADYAACVAEGACDKAEPRRRGAGDVPATGVSFDDATDYAGWLSDRTGQTWRLPTVEEWAFAAGSKAVDHALGIETDGLDPAERWLLQYEKEAALGDNAFATPEPLGTFGTNEFGVADLSEVVWEWTATCASRTTLGSAGATLSHVESCGVRYLEGRHRTPMSAFVRDAVGGGCSIGAPPDNLGFRLVRETSWAQRAERALQAWFRPA